jgi:hypothetical protein
MERLAKQVTLWLAYTVFFFMLILLFAAIVNMRRPGSLDDLPSDLIKKAVDEP